MENGPLVSWPKAWNFSTIKRSVSLQRIEAFLSGILSTVEQEPSRGAEESRVERYPATVSVGHFSAGLLLLSSAGLSSRETDAARDPFSLFHPTLASVQLD